MAVKCTEGHDYRKTGEIKTPTGKVIQYRCNNCGDTKEENE